MKTILCRLEFDDSRLFRKNGSAFGSRAIDRDLMYCFRCSRSSSSSSIRSFGVSVVLERKDPLRLGVDGSLSIRLLVDLASMVCSLKDKLALHLLLNSGSVDVFAFGFKEQRLSWFFLWNAL